MESSSATEMHRRSPDSRNSSEIQPPVRKQNKLTSLAWKIIPFASLPEWLKDNEYIRGSYRPPMFSFRGCFKSIFRLHNETWNIWTHLLGALFFVTLVTGMYIFGDYITGWFEDVTITDLPPYDQLMLSFFFGGAITCLMCSALYHTLHNHSKNISVLFSRLDYSGIAFLITGSSVPAYYYGFYCASIAKYVHIGIILVLCVICLSVSMLNRFHTPKFRSTRYIVFVAFGLYGVVPGVHIYLRDGYALASHAYALRGILSMAALYIGGGALYAMRIPERFWPGKFDVWASSHQLFHVCVVMGSLVHYNALLTMIRYRLDTGSCSMPGLDLLTGTI